MYRKDILSYHIQEIYISCSIGKNITHTGYDFCCLTLYVYICASDFRLHYKSVKEIHFQWVELFDLCHPSTLGHEDESHFITICFLPQARKINQMSRSHADVHIYQINYIFTVFMLPVNIQKTLFIYNVQLTAYKMWSTQYFEMSQYVGDVLDQLSYP